MSATNAFTKFCVIFAGLTIAAGTARCETTANLPIEALLSTIYSNIEDDATQDLLSDADGGEVETKGVGPVWGKWAGAMRSAASRMEVRLEAALAPSAGDNPTRPAGTLSLVEQGNVYSFQLVRGYVSRTGRVTWVALAETAQKAGQPSLVLVIDAEYAAPSRLGRTTQPASVQGDYQLYAVDAQGMAKLVDRGSLGIIAILIGL